MPTNFDGINLAYKVLDITGIKGFKFNSANTEKSVDISTLFSTLAGTFAVDGVNPAGAAGIILTPDP